MASHGHSADTVTDEGLGGADDDAVVAAATAAARMLITLDRGMANARSRPEGSHAGIVVLRIRDQSANAVVERLRVLLEHHDLDDLAGSIVVVREHLIRIRRPTV